jgi:hypothetical protein
MSDATKIYELYAENAAANEQPQMKVNKHGGKKWRLHGIVLVNGTKMWWLHGKLHREDGPAIELADGDKEWWLNDVYYANADAWAQALLKMRNEPHDEESVQKFVRMILTKDDLL